jgi:maltooligosyltrehalose trehalohydrolase
MSPARVMSPARAAFGADLVPGIGTRFRLWAPSCPRVELEVLQATRWVSHPMSVSAEGWHELMVAEAGAGFRYRFKVHMDSGTSLTVPDPASRSNPDGVHGPSEVINANRHEWRTAAWRGRPWSEAVIYELHIGTFTDEGTFLGAIRRLPELAALGITALQVMPLAAFSGTRNWGYDGVLPFAPAACYGRPDDLKTFIDAAHAEGMMVLLDVVYNHFGPDGNYLHAYCPQFFNPAHRTPWGAAINFDGPWNRPVRDFFVQNALYWVLEYRFDGLRLDAVHAIHDDSETDIVCEIGAALAQAAGASPGPPRHLHLVLENHANQPEYLERGADGTPLCATAQWDDDVHHALHVLVTRETDGYYTDYAATPLEQLGRSLTEGFAYQGEHSHYGKAARGAKSAHLPPTAFVGFLQNHDMVGNRAFGDRIAAIADAALMPAAYGCLLLTPQPPMLFMGEEFAASSPFLYFCDFGGDLAKAVREGRRHEFLQFAAFGDEEAIARIPDPNAPATFAASKLHWDERETEGHRQQLGLVRELLALRRRYLVPRVALLRHGGRYRVWGELLGMDWDFPDGSSWHALANFGRSATAIAELPGGETIFCRGIGRPPAGREDEGARLDGGAILITQSGI